jgi:hypothetical protein
MYIRKNQLVRYAKISIDPEGFSVICIYLEDAILRSIGAERVNKADHVVDNPLVVTLPVCELLRTYAASLAPYPDSKLMSNQALTDLKILEGIHLLLELHPGLAATLFDFSAPGKIDLEAYMNQHYRRNIPLSQFAYLSVPQRQ